MYNQFQAPSDGASASRVRPSDGGLAEAAMQIDFSDLLNAGSDSFPNTDRTVEQVLNDSLSRLVQVLSDQQDASAATSHDDPMDTRPALEVTTNYSKGAVAAKILLTSDTEAEKRKRAAIRKGRSYTPIQPEFKIL